MESDDAARLKRNSKSLKDSYDPRETACFGLGVEPEL